MTRRRNSIRLSDSDHEQLQQWVRRRVSPHRLVVRSQIVLLASGGVPVATIAEALNVAPHTVRLWTRRFEAGGVGALTKDAPGRGRPKGLSVPVTLRVIEAMGRITRGERSVRAVAARAGASASTVWRIWNHHAINRDSSSDTLDGLTRQLIYETHKRAK